MIKFKSLIPEILKQNPIKKCKPNDFKWFNKTLEDLKRNGPFNIHIGRCPGIISILNKGWIQYSYQDFIIETNGDLESFKWYSEIDQKKLKNGNFLGDYISSHPKEQLQKFKPFLENTLHAIIKIQSPWVVYIPDGYSLLSMPIPYNDDVRFTAATGFLKKMSFCNVQIYWHRLNSKELIKKGTPLCQYLLFKDEEIDFEISKMNKNDISHLKKLREANNIF
jgi:hypothetical protein